MNNLLIAFLSCTTKEPDVAPFLPAENSPAPGSWHRMESSALNQRRNRVPRRTGERESTVSCQGLAGSAFASGQMGYGLLAVVICPPRCPEMLRSAYSGALCSKFHFGEEP